MIKINRSRKKRKINTKIEKEAKYKKRQKLVE